VFLYTVACEFESAQVAQEWVDWLEQEHLADVGKAGAHSAEVVRIDGDSIRYEVRYHFNSRLDFEVYEREHAPRLRAEGLRLFPPTLGLRYSRSTGEVVITTHESDARSRALS
jgi:hypothetical protein